VTSLFAGFYYWFPKMSGRWHSEFLAHLHFWVFFVGVNMVFFPMHFLGMQGMPRRYPDYAPAFETWNHLSTVGYMVMSMSIVIFLINIAYAFIAGKRPPPITGARGPRRWNGRSPARRLTTSSRRCLSSATITTIDRRPRREIPAWVNLP
jgi:heme/copper-type cytochrome/quinol oxidase subunit 1